jgi:subtilisin family serine protease
MSPMQAVQATANVGATTSLPAAAETGSTVMALGTPDAVSAAPRQATPATAATEPASFLVQFAADATLEQKAAALAAAGAEIKETVRAGDASAGDLVLVEAKGHDADTVIGTLSNAAGVSHAEVNGQLGVQAVANDPYYTNGSAWGMYGDTTSPANTYGSQAAEAWAAGDTGKSSIVVGDVDSGVDYTHPDLYLNIWLNQGELPKTMALVDADTDGLITFRDLNQAANANFVSDINGSGYIDAGDLLKDARWEDHVDQDGNGYVDDLIGWDFVNNDNDPYDDNGHGTHTAGTIGATGDNGTGVAGVNWNVQIMALKFLDKSGSGSTANAIKALDYYTAASAADQAHGWTSEFIGTNNSWGGSGYSQSMLDAIVRGAKQDALFIVAAGNGGSDGRGDNNDVTATYPANYSTLSGAGYEAVISVAALTSSGALASYSNYGSRSVDLAAPGSNVWSTVPGGGYASYSGTSMAAPHVTGALALYASLHPDYTAEQLRDALLSSTEATSSLAGKTATGGRLDIGDLVNTSSDTPAATPSGQTLYGTTASDTIVGTNYADVLSGVPATGTNPGRGTIDTLYGQGGNDLFVLGDARGAFYDDGNALNAGARDYAIVADFASGDRIQLASGQYILMTTTVAGVSGTGIYRDLNGRFDATDELVGIVKNVLPTQLSNADFNWA